MLSQEIKFARMLSKNRKYAGIMSNDKKIYTWYCPSMIKTRKLFPKKTKQYRDVVRQKVYSYTVL